MRVCRHSTCRRALRVCLCVSLCMCLCCCVHVSMHVCVCASSRLHAPRTLPITPPAGRSSAPHWWPHHTSRAAHAVSTPSPLIYNRIPLMFAIPPPKNSLRYTSSRHNPPPPIDGQTLVRAQTCHLTCHVTCHSTMSRIHVF